MTTTFEQAFKAATGINPADVYTIGDELRDTAARDAAEGHNRMTITTSPWGAVQECDEMAPGIWHVTTASHGGIVLDQAHADRIPADIKPFIGSGLYWEEDSDWAVPMLLFADEIKPTEQVLTYARQAVGWEGNTDNRAALA